VLLEGLSGGGGDWYSANRMEVRHATMRISVLRHRGSGEPITAVDNKACRH